AAELVDEYPDGVSFVPLASISDPALVLTAIAGVLGVHEHAGRPLLDGLQQALQPQPRLLVLDNFEQIVTAGTDIATPPGACGRWSRAGSRCTCVESVSTPCRRWRCLTASSSLRQTAWRRAPRLPSSWNGRRQASPTSPSPRRMRPPWPRSAVGWTGCRWRSS